MKQLLSSVMSPFQKGFTRAEIPNTFINLLAPLASYSLIPVVTKIKVAQSNISDREKEIVVAQEVPKQAINALITVLTFVTGKHLGPGLLRMTGMGKRLSSEGATLIATGMLNFLAYTFARPLLSLELFDRWFDKKYQSKKTVDSPATFSTPFNYSQIPQRTSFRQGQQVNPSFNRAAFSAHPQLPRQQMFRV